MSIYAAQRRRAAATIRAKGAAVALEYDVPGVYDDVTGRESDGETRRADGYAVEITSQSQAQEAMDRLAQLPTGGVVLVDPVVLLVAAEGLAFEPKQNHRMTWAGKVYVVKEAQPLAPDGTPITWTIVGGRG